MARFSIRVDLWSRPLLWPFDVRESRAYVEVTERQLKVRFGFFRQSFPLDQIVDVHRIKGRLLDGIGWHTDLFRTVIVNGSLRGQVEINLAQPARVWVAFVPAKCMRLRVSLDDPDGFIEALAGRQS